MSDPKKLADEEKAEAQDKLDTAYDELNSLIKLVGDNYAGISAASQLDRVYDKIHRCLGLKPK